MRTLIVPLHQLAPVGVTGAELNDRTKCTGHALILHLEESGYDGAALLSI